MPSIYDIKPRFQALLRPLVLRLATMGVTANQVTVLALLLSLLCGLCMFLWSSHTWPLLLLPLVLLLRMALNAIDGMLAREHDMQSSLGAILNELSDVFSDVALYLPFAFFQGIASGWVVAAVLLAVISEMAGVVAVQIGAERRYDGPMGKSDRALVFSLIAVALALGLVPIAWLNIALIGIVLLLALTIYNRCRRALEQVA